MGYPGSRRSSVTLGDGGRDRDGIPACCCGRADCAFLAHSCKLLEAVEKDARTAGELGQALLTRHENYVADAERDRARMLECISHLEAEKCFLETKNKNAIEENRKLLDQLEALNTAVIESDAKILSLTDALRSADQNVERLTGLAARTERLQDQLQKFEEEQESLQRTLKVTREDERTAVLRWQRAERTMQDLQDQLDKIEREAREEAERHGEVIARMERRRAVEQELHIAAGRLKGAAAAKTMPEGTSTVVSHFVKDILQDNANLQMGIVELKEMLDRSNEEVERLRQVMQQPENDGHASPQQQPSTPSLGAELNAKELHVHHHYHAPAAKTEALKAPRREFQRRPKKKRVSMSPGVFYGPSHTPRSSVGSMHSPTASAIISQTSASVPQQVRGNKRWSVQSNQTGSSTFSSLPSSPYGDSVFDRVFSDVATDTGSRPTSPESDALSPTGFGFTNQHRRKDSIPQFSLDDSLNIRTVSDGAIPTRPQLQISSGKGKQRMESPLLEYDSWQGNQHTILEEAEDDEEDTDGPGTERPSTPEHERILEQKFTPHNVTPPRDIPKLRRAASHESIISVHGADIHTLQSRPSQLLVGQRRMFSAGSPATSAVQAEISGTSVVAAPFSRSPASGGSASHIYLSTLAATQRAAPRANAPLAKKSSMGQLGSWVMGRWGYTATPNPPPPPPPPPPQAHQAQSSPSPAPPGTIVIKPSAPPRTVSAETASVSSSGSGPTKAGASPSTPTPRIFMRPPGINQKGPIFGFGPETPLPRTVVTSVVDHDALAESLK